jgi:DNA primase large subunit
MVSEMPTALDDHPLMNDVVARLRQSGESLLTVYAPHGPAQDGGGGVGLNLQNFEIYLEQSFPPCMKHLVMHQRMGRHLKNQGRLQLRPFLREAGLSLDGALKWWQRELCRDPSVSLGDFVKSYKYEIEHTHGAQGHRRGTFCFSCKRIIGFQTPLAGEASGCPFKVLSTADLAYLLPFWKVPAIAVQAIVDQAALGGPELACAAFFQATHPAQRDLEIVRHPNEFLRRSRRMREEVAANMPQVETTISTPAPVAEQNQEVHIGSFPSQPEVAGRPIASPVGFVRESLGRQLPKRTSVNVALGPFPF